MITQSVHLLWITYFGEGVPVTFLEVPFFPRVGYKRKYKTVYKVQKSLYCILAMLRRNPLTFKILECLPFCLRKSLMSITYSQKNTVIHLSHLILFLNVSPLLSGFKNPPPYICSLGKVF